MTFLVIRRINTTTLYHSAAIFWYNIKHQLLLKKCCRFVKKQITMATGKLCKNTPYFNFSCSYLKDKLGDLHFLFLKCNQYARMKLSAKLKKYIRSKFRATLNNWKFRVALNRLCRIFLNFAESRILTCWSLLRNKKLGSPS